MINAATALALLQGAWFYEYRERQVNTGRHWQVCSGFHQKNAAKLLQGSFLKAHGYDRESYFR